MSISRIIPIEEKEIMVHETCDIDCGYAALRFCGQNIYYKKKINLEFQVNTKITFLH